MNAQADSVETVAPDGAQLGAGEGQTAAPAAAPETSAPAPKATPRSRAESAMARAMERADKARQVDESAAAGRQAATGDGGDGTAPDAADAGGREPPAAGAQAGATPPADSTVTAPQDWPREWTAQFSALPTDDARQLVLAMNKDMTAGLQRGLQSLAEQRRGSESMFEAMKRTGHASGEVEALLDLSARFKDDPRGVLESLAQQAGVELAELAEDKPPEFADAAELAKWASNKARRDVERQLQAERQRDQAQREAQQAQERFDAELRDAGSKFADLREHWPAVADVLARHPLLSVGQAYQLARFDAMQAAVAERDALKAQVAKLQAAEETRRKQATQPPAGAGGNGTPVKAVTQSRAEAAMARAERRLAAERAA